MLDPADHIPDETFSFIEQALSKTESILIHSVKGQSRSCTILGAYLMRRYRWSLLKSLEFMNSRRPDLEIRATFVHQLTDYEKRLKNRNMGPITEKWTEIFEQTNQFENEELLLRNTYMNAQVGAFADFIACGVKEKPDKILWVDIEKQDVNLLATEIVVHENFTEGNDNDAEEVSKKKNIAKSAEKENKEIAVVKTLNCVKNSQWKPKESVKAIIGKEKNEVLSHPMHQSIPPAIPCKKPSPADSEKELDIPINIHDDHTTTSEKKNIKKEEAKLKKKAPAVIIEKDRKNLLTSPSNQIRVRCASAKIKREPLQPKTLIKKDERNKSHPKKERPLS